MKISIDKDTYFSLVRDSLKLNCLENAGVDNWEWYGDAMDEYEEHLKTLNIEINETSCNT